MNVAQMIEDLMFVRAAYDNPSQGPQSKRYQYDQLVRARERLHRALSEQINENLREMSAALLDKGHGGV